jgi:uncharacterized membrane protein
MRRQADLSITAAVAVLACTSVMFRAPVAVTSVLGIALLAAPGYLLGQLLFDSRIDGLERVAVFTSLALCVPVLGGLLLAMMRVPLHRAAWLGLLAGTTLLGDLALLLRRWSGRAAAHGGQREVNRPPVRHIAAFAAAALIAAGALGLARAGARIQSYPGFTQLWLAHPDKNAATVNLGVSNHEGRAMRYRLVLLHNGHRDDSWNLALANGQTWHESPVFSGRYTVAANLYRLPDLSHPYRHVVINTNGVPNS